MTRINNRAHKDPFILMGDLNAGENNPAILYLKAQPDQEESSPIRLIDSFRAAHPDARYVATGSKWKGQLEGPKIDYIMVTPDTKVHKAAIIRSNEDGRFPSDHYPVSADITLK